MKNYNIAFSINRNYLLFCFVTIHSLVKNNQKSFFNIYIQHNNCITQEDINNFTNKIPLKNLNNFKVFLLNMSDIEELSDIEDGGKWTKEVYFKLFLPDLLPKEDKVLYLDADVAIIGDIQEYLDTNMENHTFCGDKFGDKLNCGVLLINLDLARKTNVHKEVFSKIKEQYFKDRNDFYKLTEEYVINAFFSEKIIFSRNIITLASKNDLIENKNYKIVHYLGIKPWHLDRKISKDIKPLYISYLSNLKEFSKNKFLTVFVFYYLIYGGYFINNITRRIKNSIYKNIFRMPKYKYLHQGLTMSFFIKNSIVSK